MEPLFRANRAILAQMMLTVRFCQFDVVYWLPVLSLFVICVFILGVVFVYLYLCICICVFVFVHFQLNATILLLQQMGLLPTQGTCRKCAKSLGGEIKVEGTKRYWVC